MYLCGMSKLPNASISEALLPFAFFFGVSLRQPSFAACFSFNASTSLHVIHFFLSAQGLKCHTSLYTECQCTSQGWFAWVGSVRYLAVTLCVLPVVGCAMDSAVPEVFALNSF